MSRRCKRHQRLILFKIGHRDGMLKEVSRAIAREAVKDERVDLLLGLKGIDYYTLLNVKSKVERTYGFTQNLEIVTRPLSKEQRTMADYLRR